jgi:hypothetical protein
MQIAGYPHATDGMKTLLIDDDVKSTLSDISKEDMESSQRSSEDAMHNLTAGLLEMQQHDVESQNAIAPEHYVSTKAKLLFLAAYFFLNLFLTLSNKAVLGVVSSEPKIYLTPP